METYKTTTKFNKNDFIRANKIKWKFLILKRRKQAIIFSIAACLIIINEISNRMKGESDEVSTILAFIVLLSTIWILITNYFRKQKFYHQIENIANEYEEKQMDCTFEFSDESVKYWDKEKSLEFKWNVFKHYSIYRNYLIFRINSSLVDTFIFERKEDDYDDYEKALEFAKEKLVYKKI